MEFSLQVCYNFGPEWTKRCVSRGTAHSLTTTEIVQYHQHKTSRPDNSTGPCVAAYLSKHYICLGPYGGPMGEGSFL